MPGSARTRTFDPVLVGNRETDAWAAYYRREWRTFLVAAVGMVSAGFGMRPHNTLVGAWHVLRANQLWAPYPDNDPDGARRSMRRFYTLVLRDSDLTYDPVRAAELEVEWWRLHRAHQHDPAVPDDALVQALVELYAHVYSAPAASMTAAARHRVEAMDLSDAWVRAGCAKDDPLLAAEREALVASYSALRAALGRPPTLVEVPEPPGRGPRNHVHERADATEVRRCGGFEAPPLTLRRTSTHAGPHSRSPMDRLLLLAAQTDPANTGG